MSGARWKEMPGKKKKSTVKKGKKSSKKKKPKICDVC